MILLRQVRNCDSFHLLLMDQRHLVVRYLYGARIPYQDSLHKYLWLRRDDGNCNPFPLVLR